MSNEEYEAIMSKGYKDVLADYENGIVRGWMFLATLYDYAKAKGKIKDATEPEIDQRIRDIDILIRKRKEGISLDPLTRKNMGGDSTPENIKRKGALITL